MAQSIVGAPVMYPSATVAANATRFRHATKSMPNAVCVVWFDHWGTYGQPGREYYDNWGHVVIWDPVTGKFWSSTPRAGHLEGPWAYSTIAEVERAFNCTFRFWTEDINGLRVCQPATASNWEDTLKHFYTATKRRAKQVIPANEQTRVRFNDNNDTTFALGTGDIVGASTTVRLKGKPGGRAEITMVREAVNANLVETKTERIAQERAVFDDLGLVTVNVSGSCPIKNQRMRIIVHTSASAGKVTVERCEVGGYARPGK